MSGALDVEPKQSWFRVGLKVSRQSALYHVITPQGDNVLLFTGFVPTCDKFRAWEYIP